MYHLNGGTCSSMVCANGKQKCPVVSSVWLGHVLSLSWQRKVANDKHIHSDFSVRKKYYGLPFKEFHLF